MPVRRPIRSLINTLRRRPSTQDQPAADVPTARLAGAADAAIAPLRRALMEDLERRQLLTTITGSGSFEYKDADDGLVRVRWANVTAELVFASVSGGTARLTNHIPAGSMADGRDLYNVYVVESSVDSFISIARVPALTAEDRSMTPFAGGATIRFNNLNNGENVTGTVGDGDVYVGARTNFDSPADNRAILNQRFNGLGIVGPRPNGRLNAGLIIAGGQDFGRFFLGGTITGQVAISGSIDQFYAGGIATGNAEGVSSTDPDAFEAVPSNFSVGGDIRDLTVGGNVGGIPGGDPDEPIFLTGFDMRVGGTVGSIDVNGSFYGNVDVRNDPNTPRLRLRQREVEFVNHVDNDSPDDFEGLGTPDGLPRLGGANANGTFRNDSFDTPQHLGVFDSRTLGKNVVQLNGTLQAADEWNDMTDYYGIPLLGGQTVTIRMIQEDFNVIGDVDPFINVGVFDPDGRLIATDYNDTASQDWRQGFPFQIKADRPGVYRIAVAVNDDVNFDGDTTDPDELNGTQFFPGFVDYQLQVQGLGELGMGALFATGDVFDGRFGSFVVDPTDPDPLDVDTDPAIEVRLGDLGAVNAGGSIASFLSGTGGRSIAVSNGNLRSLDAASIGYQSGAGIGNGPSLYVPKGSIGLIRATGNGGSVALSVEMALRSDFAGFDDENVGVAFDQYQLYEPVGNDIQMVVANDELDAILVANKRIGSIRADSMPVNRQSVFAVDADDAGRDGTIDLIDITGNMGSGAQGGPQITTGTGGNVRYLRVGGDLFRDRLFGIGSPELQVFQPGERVTRTDDSGATITFTPIPNQRRFENGQVVPVNPGTLTMEEYPIRSGGSIVARVTSTRGLQVDVNGGAAEVGEIEVTGAGAGVIEQQRDVFGNNVLTGQLVLDPNSTEDLSVILNGSVVDVLSIQGGNFNRILNRSSGEIVNINAASIGQIAGKTLGLARSHTPAAVIPQAIDFGLGNATLGIADGVANTYPLLDERKGIFVSGNLVSAQASQSIGNILVAGTAQSIVANSDGRFTSGVFEGIDGVLLAGSELRFVNIGEGLNASGTGNVSRAGIYADGRIVQVVNQGLGSDIRGDIVSRGNNIVINNPVTGRADPRNSGGIVSVVLNNGAIIDANLMVVSSFAMAREFTIGGTFPNAGGGTTQPVFEIGSIITTGQGGIIGSQIFGADIGNVIVSEGFGIVSSLFRSPAQGTLRNVIADGFGIRDTRFAGGGQVGTVNARGKGTKASTNAYTASVRASEKRTFDAYSGRQINSLNDLHKYIGTTAAAPVRVKGSRSVTGVIDNVIAAGGVSAGSLQGYRIRASSFNFGNAIGTIDVRDSIDLMTIRTGGIGMIRTAADMNNADVRVSGEITTVAVGGTYRGTNTIRATGPDGFVRTFATRRGLFGELTAEKGMGDIKVGTDLGSENVESRGNINAIRVSGNVVETADVRTTKAIVNLVVTGDILEGASIEAREIVNQSVGGDVLGDIEITG